jgi:hypothetical protein
VHDGDVAVALEVAGPSEPVHEARGW